jgi:prefoldin subunit 5
MRCVIIFSKFNFMHESFLVQKRATQRKIPDIQQAIEVVEFLKKKGSRGEELSTRFPLTDNCHILANVPPADTVCLWLGANVMLEYPIGDAEELLKTSSVNANESISRLDENLVFLRDQITTTEVNIARLHNFMVKIKAQLRADESGIAQESRTVAAK